MSLSPLLNLNSTPCKKRKCENSLHTLETTPIQHNLKNVSPICFEESPFQSEKSKKNHLKAEIDENVNNEQQNKKKLKGNNWSQNEDEMLKNAVSMYSGRNWKDIAAMVPGRTHSQCSQRWRRIQPFKNRQAWTKEEDKTLVELVQKNGCNWSLISSFIEGRTGKQVRERYLNKLDPKINRNRFTAEEDLKILKLYRQIGARWREISKSFEGRPENMIKNRFYSFIKKKYDDCLISREKDRQKEEEIFKFINSGSNEHINLKKLSSGLLKNGREKNEEKMSAIETTKFPVDIMKKEGFIAYAARNETPLTKENSSAHQSGSKNYFNNEENIFQYLMNENQENNLNENRNEIFLRENLKEKDEKESPKKQTFAESEVKRDEFNDPIDRMEFLTKKKKVIENLLVSLLGKIQDCEIKKELFHQ